VLGVLACFAVVVFASDRLYTCGYRLLRRRLCLELAKDGIEAEGGVFVNFAPEREPRLYEGYANWDVGLLFLEKDRLVYLGDHVRCAIPRERVVDVTLEKGFPSWSRSLRVCVHYKGVEENAEHDLALWVVETRSVRGSRPLTKDLLRRIEAWGSGDTAGEAAPSLPQDLGLPNLGEVTSEPPRAAISADRVAQTMIFVSAAAVLVSMLFGLGFSSSDGGGWLVLFMALLSAAFQLIPIRLGSGAKS
jgi:hypothetical protein